MATAAYVRVSSKAADDASQRAAIARCCAAIDRWYAEKLSAKTTQRPALQSLLADARAGRFDRLVTFSLDRLCRTGVRDTYRVVDELRRAGVTLHCIRENLTVTPSSEDVTSTVLLFAFGLAAQLERTATKERIASARVRLAAKGQPWGRPRKTMFGDVERVRKMRAEGMTIAQVANAMRVSASTINRLLRNST